MSRAYYAAYHAALRLLATKQIPVTSSGNQHEAVWNVFLRGPSKDWKAVCRIGDSLKKKRVEADYLLKPKKWTEEAKAAVTEAKHIQHWLRQIASQQPPT